MFRNMGPASLRDQQHQAQLQQHRNRLNQARRLNNYEMVITASSAKQQQRQQQMQSFERHPLALNNVRLVIP